MNHHLLFTLIFLLFLSGSTITFTKVTYAAVPSGCINPKATNTLHGTLTGTQINYTISMPSNWNGTLLLYSYIYTSPTDPSPNPAPIASDSTTQGALLQQGYALAGSSYGSRLAVQPAIPDQIALLDLFKNQFGSASRTIAWGPSLVGMITARLI